MTKSSKYNYDLLAIDLDGTLFDTQGNISSRNIDAVHRARDAGIEVVLCSGRGRAEMGTVLDPLSMSGPVITAGGAMIVDYNTRETIYRAAMPTSLVTQLTEHLLGYERHAVLLFKDRWVTKLDYLVVGEMPLDPASEWWFNAIPVNVAYVDSITLDPHPLDTVRVGIVAEADHMPEITESMQNVFGDSIFLHHFPAVTSGPDGKGRLDGATHLLEAFNPTVNKWTAIARLASMQNVQVARIAAIGDQRNDEAMIQHAGLGIAMGNATDEIKAIANQVTWANTDDGVANAIDAILEGRW